MKQTSSLTHRKANCKIRFVDKLGQPLAHQTLALEQTKHEFLFGCGAFDSLLYCSYAAQDDKALFEDRVNKWLALYNYGTLPFYWGQFEPEEGNVLAEPLMKAATFLTDHGVKVKGHPLCWHTVCADWLMKYDNETILEKQLQRIHREVAHFKGTIDMWDVINEVVIMPNFDKYDNAITRICKTKGRIGLIKDVFTEAKRTNPDAILLLNDFNTSVAYEILIEACLEAGVPIDAIGIQSHQHQGYWGREKFEEVLHRFERFNLPIHFTENTLVSGALMPAHIVDLNDWQVPSWPTDPEGEERQMHEMEEIYRLLFDHPLVEAITGWDLVDGGWLGAPSGVLRKDNSPKPAYDRLMKLIKDEWWTKTTVQTDSDGYAVLEGIKGDYLITYNGESLPFTLSKNTPDTQLQFTK